MSEYKQIDIHEVNEMLSQPVIIVDIRNPMDYEQGHIANAVSLTDTNLKEFFTKTDKEKPLICYCYHGISSRSAADFLNKQGFGKVYSMQGGFEAWKTAYPVSKP